MHALSLCALASVFGTMARERGAGFLSKPLRHDGGLVLFSKTDLVGPTLRQLLERLKIDTHRVAPTHHEAEALFANWHGIPAWHHSPVDAFLKRDVGRISLSKVAHHPTSETTAGNAIFNRRVLQLFL